MSPLTTRGFRTLLLAGLVVFAEAYASTKPSLHGVATVELGDSCRPLIQPLEGSAVLRVQCSGTRGWLVSVADQRDGAGGSLLYDSTQWHGPYPSDVLAWNIDLFSDRRWLCVHRHRPAYEVIATLEDHAVEGSGPDARFTRGALRIEWWRRACREHRPDAQQR